MGNRNIGKEFLWAMSGYTHNDQRAQFINLIGNKPFPAFQFPPRRSELVYYRYANRNAVLLPANGGEYKILIADAGTLQAEGSDILEELWEIKDKMTEHGSSPYIYTQMPMVSLVIASKNCVRGEIVAPFFKKTGSHLLVVNERGSFVGVPVKKIPACRASMKPVETMSQMGAFANQRAITQIMDTTLRFSGPVFFGIFKNERKIPELAALITQENWGDPRGG